MFIFIDIFSSEVIFSKNYKLPSRHILKLENVKKNFQHILFKNICKAIVFLNFFI